MSYLRRLKARGKDLVAMIHLEALPGTPKNKHSPDTIVAKAVAEAETYKAHGIDTVMIENMHDVPYTRTVGPEVTAVMTRAGREVKALGLDVGVQVLAGCNQEALAVALAAGLDFVRVEGFVFSHVGDEGMMDACAGELLRYRKRVGAENVAVFTDIKKKHSAHAITADVSISEVAHAADFFLSDGVIITGTSTGNPADLAELEALQNVGIRKLIGSGITSENLATYFPFADAFVVGSTFKVDGYWENALDPARIDAVVAQFEALKAAG